MTEEHEKPNNPKHTINEIKRKIQKNIAENNQKADKPNSYKPYERFSSYFQKINRDNPKGNVDLKTPIFNITEAYKGFTRMSGYAMGIAVSILLISWGGFTIFDKFKHIGNKGPTNSGEDSNKKIIKDSK